MTDGKAREQQFLERLQEVLRTARLNRNTITEEELEEAFSGLQLDGDQMRQVRDYLAANHIGIGEALSLEEVLSEDEHDFLQDYMRQLEAAEPLDGGMLEAVKLSAMAGDRQAQRRLAEYMLPQVVDIARLYAGQDVYLEDLIGAGNEALMRGVALLAPLEGPEEVEADLARRVMDAMEDLVAENLDARAQDQQIVELVNRVADSARELAEALGRSVTPEELAAEGDVTVEEIMEALGFAGPNIEDIDAGTAPGTLPGSAG